MNLFKRIVRASAGAFLMIIRFRVFYPKKIFGGKRVAIIGPADSAYDERMGDYIDKFDYVIRINKAIVTWQSEKSKYLGTRTDILVHSFIETDFTGGGMLDFKLFQKHGITYILNAKHRFKDFRQIFNMYKKYLTWNKIYILSQQCFNDCESLFKKYKEGPTNGFRALHMVLSSDFKEVFITGFTFYKTPYASGYRDELKDMSVNAEHMKMRGAHNADLEFNLFLRMFEKKRNKILLDDRLRKIINN